MIRAVLVLLLAAVSALAIPLECNVPVKGDIQPFGAFPATVVYDFDVQANEAILLRVMYLTADKDFKPRIVMRDAGNSPVSPRLSVAANSVSFAAEYLVPLSGRTTVEVQATTNISGSFRIAMLRLNRPCANATLACGAPVGTAMNLQLEMRSYRFDAAANDIVSFRWIKTGPLPQTSGGVPTPPPPSNIALVVYGPDGLMANNLDGKPAAVQQASYVADPSRRGAGNTRMQVDVKAAVDGPLTAVLYDQYGNSSEFSLSASRLNGGCGDKPLACGASVDATIDQAVEYDGYTVSAQAGDVYQLRMVRKDTTGKFQPYAEIYDPAGKLIANLKGTGTGPRGLLFGTFRAAAAGRYSILTGDATNGSETGGYTVALNRINRPCGNSPALGCASLLDAGVDGVLRQNTYTLNASARDTFLVRLQRTGGGSFKPRLDIYDADGATVQTATTTDVARVGFTAPAAGDYVVVVADNFDGTQSGAYSLASVRLNRPCNATPLECGKVAAGSIDSPLRNALFTYDSTAGDSFAVRLLNPGAGMQPDIEVYTPDGQRTGTGASGNFRAVDVARPGAGAFTVLAFDSKAQNKGPFALALLRTRNACGVAPPQGQTVSGLVSGATPFVSYSIPAGAGDLLMVRSASFTPGFNTVMELYDPDGVRVDSGTYSISRRAAAAGTYTAVLGASNPSTAGAFALSWQLLNNPTNAAALMCGSTAGGTLSAASAYRYYLAGLNTGDLAKFLLTPVTTGFAPQVELYEPNGTRVATSASEILQRVRVDGNHLVVVTPSTASGESGTFSVALQRPNHPCGLAPLACGQSLLRQIDQPGQFDGITFSGNAGDLTTLRLVVRGGTLAPFAELYDTTGTLVRTSSTGVLSLPLPATGSYNMLVRDRAGSGTGAYRATLQTEPPCAVNDRTPPAVTLLRPTGGEVAVGGSVFRIAWQSDDNVDVASHDVRLSTDGGQTFPAVIAAGVSGAAQFYDWPVPTSVSPTRTAVVQVTATDGSGNSQSAASDLIALIGSGFKENVNVKLAYDAMNRVTQAAYSDGRTLQYSYDGNGNLVQISVSLP